MTKEEMFKMASEAGFSINEMHCSPPIISFIGYEEHMEAFAKLVAAQTLMKIDPRSFMSYQEGFEAGQLAERERIKEQNAPEIEKTNAYIKQLELEKMESDILHNEHLKLLGEIKAMTEAARLAEREACADIAENWRCNGMPRTGVANEIRARGQQ